MEIFVIREGKQAGPYSEDALRALLTEGAVRTKDMGWRKGLSAWMPLGEVLKSDSEKPPERADKPADAGTNGSSQKADAATAKQKALLKYLGLDSGIGAGKEAAAVAIRDAMENPKFQGRIRKWQEEKLRLHPNLFQDEIDFQKANRTIRYLELCETEGAGVVKDVTKAHVQVLVESLDKRFPSWESEPRAAVWDYLFPAIAEHFPKLVLPAAQGRLKMGGQPKVAVALSGPPAGGIIAHAPPQHVGPVSAAFRGLMYGAVVLGLIFVANHFFHFASFHFPTQPAPVAQPAQPGAPKEGDATQPPRPAGSVAVVNPGEIPPIPPAVPAAEPAVPPVPVEPVAVPPAPAPPMAENKPPVVEEKPAPAPAPKPVETPAPVSTTPPPPATPAPATPAPSTPRSLIKLVQGISVPLPNGAVTLQAGTQLRFLAVEGPNVRVSWNNNVFHVPAIATDVGDATPAPATPSPIPALPATQPKAPGIPPAPGIPAVPMAPKKPSDDL